MTKSEPFSLNLQVLTSKGLRLCTDFVYFVAISILLIALLVTFPLRASHDILVAP